MKENLAKNVITEANGSVFFKGNPFFKSLLYGSDIYTCFSDEKTYFNPDEIELIIMCVKLQLFLRIGDLKLGTKVRIWI